MHFDRRQLTEHVDRAIEQAISEKKVVGTVLLIAVDGEIVYARAAGMADRERSYPVKMSTIFLLASVTKVIVSIAAVALIEKGILSLDAPITHWLPEFRPVLGDHSIPRITVEHLLTHTSGLGYGFEPEGGLYQAAGISNGLDMPGVGMEEQLGRLASVPLLFAPGTTWRYSLSTDVLGALLGKAAGMSLPEAIHTLVSRPLGITDTDFAIVDFNRLAAPYVDGIPEPERMGDRHALVCDAGIVRFSPSRLTNPDSYPSGGAGMAGTARDVLTILEAIRCGGAPIMGEKSAALLTRNALPELVTFPDRGWGFGLGVGVLLDPAAAQSVHDQGTWRWSGGYGHDWFVNPARKLSVVSLTNTTLAGVEGDYSRSIWTAIYKGWPAF